MATLADKLNSSKKLVRGASGVLSEETNEEVQSLANKAGLQAPPITPIGQSLIGANPDQQKMAGSPAQKQSALSLSSQPVGDTLQGAMRREQVRSGATELEAARQRKSEDMQNLGNVGDRVTQFIEVQRQKLQATQEPIQVETAQTFQSPAGTKDVSALKGILNAYRKDPSNQSLLLQINQQLGYDINRQLSPSEINQLYESTTDSIARGGAGNVDSDLTVNDLVGLGSLGYTQQQLSDLLEIPVDQISNYSVGQLRDAISSVANREFSTAQQLEQQATSLNLGAAERGLARQAGREASRVGTRSSEADVANLEQQIANADLVQFAGQEYKVDDLLRDGTISGLIRDYLESAPGSEVRERIDSTEPALSNFIQRNQLLLDDASKQMQAGTQQFQDTQAYNKSLTTMGGIPMSEQLIRALIPQSTSLQTGRIDPSSIPALAVGAQYSPDRQAAYINALNSAVGIDSSLAGALGTVSPSTLSKWNIGGGPGSLWETNYVEPLKEYQKIQSLAGNPDSLIKYITGGKYSSGAKLESALADAAVARTLGVGGGVDISGILDANNDGNVDNAKSLSRSLAKANPKPSIASPGDNPVFHPNEIGRPDIPDNGTIERDIYNKIYDVATNGRVSAKELRGVDLNLDELIWMEDNSSPQIPQKEVLRKREEARDSNTTSIIRDTNKGRKPYPEQIDILQQLLKEQGDRRVNSKMIQEEIEALAKAQMRDIMSDKKADAEKKNKMLREQRQVVSIVYPAFAALPRKQQDIAIDLASELGNDAFDVVSSYKWNNKKTTAENMASLVVHVNKKAAKLGRKAQGMVEEWAGQNTRDVIQAPEKVLEAVQGAGSKAVTSVKKALGI